MKKNNIVIAAMQIQDRKEIEEMTRMITEEIAVQSKITKMYTLRGVKQNTIVAEVES